jgi:hypothetical protein
LFRLFLLLLISLYPTLIGINPAQAATDWSQTIQLSTPATNAVISLELSSSLSGAGTSADPYLTRNSHITLQASLVGAGRLVLTDQSGATVATYDKTTNSAEEIPFNLNLNNGVGDYNFTATYYHLDDPALIWNIAQIFVHYAATPIIPTPPADLPDTGNMDSPNTGWGYLYINGYAVPTRDVIILTALFAAFAFLIYQIFFRRRQRSAK